MIFPLLSFVTEHLAIRTGSRNRLDHYLYHVLIKSFLLNMCLKLEFFVSCTWPLLSRPLACNDDLHAIPSFPKKVKKGPKNSKPFYASFLSSSISTVSASTFSPTKNSKPSLIISSLKHQPPPSPSTAWTHGRKALSKRKSSYSQCFSSNTERIGSSVPPSSSPCELSTGMAITRSLCY